MTTEPQAKTAHSPLEQISRLEPEMQPRSGGYPMPSCAANLCELLGPALTQAFISQPLIGNVVLSPAQREQIHTLAADALANALKRTYLPDYGLNGFYCDLIVLETALLLRHWNRDSDEESAGGNANFWEYIYNQYALPYDENFGNGHAYKIFKLAIQKSLGQHKRFFVPAGQKYYTTMLFHALAPKSMFYALFEQIYAFYSRTLNYHYFKDDAAFRAFASAMKERFASGRARSDDNVYIKSVQSSSAIRALFLYCPEYMGEFVRHTINVIDTLLTGGGTDKTSYLEMMLLHWFENRSREERLTAKRERSRASTERIVTEFSQIRPTYRCEAGQVLLSIPAIRLGEQADSQPWLTIYRSPADEAPYATKLRYYGDYFCLTSSQALIPLDELLSANAQRLEPRVIISYGGKDIYDSGARLYRDAIAFGDDGAEVSKRPNREYVNIFVANDAHVQGENTSPDCTFNQCGNGLLYRTLIADQTLISVNGTNLFPVERVVSGLTLNMSVAPVSHCKYLIDRQECTIFSTQPTLTISSETAAVEKRYRLLVDDTPYPLAEYSEPSRHSFRVALPGASGVHELRIIDNTSQQRVYTLHYVVIELFSLDFDGFYYYEGFSDNGALELTDCTGSNRYPYEMQQGQDIMLIPYGEGDLAIDIPTLRCRLAGQPLPPDAEQTVWYEDIPMSALLEIAAPRGYSGTAVIGQRAIMSASVELGNEIRARNDASLETVGIIIRKGNDPPLQIKLLDIAFAPIFPTPPLLAEINDLLWCVEDNFIGNKNTQFEIRISRKGEEIARYRVGCTDEIIPLDEPLKNGVYNYTILQKSAGFFAEFEELAQEQFMVGSPVQFRFDERAVIVTEAIIDNERFPLKQASGIITELRYLGERGLNGETQHYPCYEGRLHYKYEGSLRPYATRDYERGGIFREQVNPVKLWLINDYTISLRDPLEDGLYVSKRWQSITDRTPPDRKMLRGMDADDYCNPDYYSFKVIMRSEVEHV